MSATGTTPVSDLYLEDETAWLELMSDAASRRDSTALDWQHLSEYLRDMSIRDRREVKNRLALLLSHLLKWEHQPSRRSGSWKATILIQSQELADIAGSGVLRKHAETVLFDAYKRAVKFASAETALPLSSFPTTCPYSLEDLFDIDLDDE